MPKVKSRKCWCGSQHLTCYNGHPTEFTRMSDSGDKIYECGIVSCDSKAFSHTNINKILNGLNMPWIRKG